MLQHEQSSAQLPLTTRDIQPTVLRKPQTSQPLDRFSFFKRCCHLLARIRRILIYRWWWWELTSLSVSVISMMVVLYILCKINNVALDQWTFPIQANSLVSVFLTISKSALLVSVAECISQSKWMQFSKKPLKLSRLQEYDDASRGPFGSATLLFKRVGWIARVGALLTVVSLALDPFVQQIIDFPSRPVPLPGGLAEVSATQSIDKIDIPSMRGAILSAIYSPTQDPSAPLTYTCTTSSCLWDQIITSIGVCSVCHEITDSFVPECTTTPGPLEPDPEKPEQTWSLDTTTCIYNIDPANNITLTVYLQTLTLPAANDKPAEYASEYTQVKVMSTKGYGGSHHTVPLTMAKLVDPKVRWISTALTFTTTYDKDRKRMPKMTIEELAPSLHVCGLYLCAQSYDHSLAVVNGSITNAEPTSTIPLGNIYRPEDGRAIVTEVGDGQVAEVLVYQPDSTLINYENLSKTVDAPRPSPSAPYPNGTTSRITSTLFNTTDILNSTTTEPINNSTVIIIPRRSNKILRNRITRRQETPPPSPSLLSNSSAQNNNFTISQQALFALQGRLNREILNISQSSGNIAFSDSVFPSPNYGVDLSALIAAQSSSSFSKSSGAQEQVFVNVSQTFQRLAMGITGRLWVENGAGVVSGVALVEEVFFRVAWGWVSLPVGVLVLAGGLLLGTILETRTRSAIKVGGGREMDMEMEGKIEVGVGVWVEPGGRIGTTGRVGTRTEVVVGKGREDDGLLVELEGEVTTSRIPDGSNYSSSWVETDEDTDSLENNSVPVFTTGEGEKESQSGTSSIEGGKPEQRVRFKEEKEIVNVGGKGVGIWKGSILPLLMADLQMTDMNGGESRGFREELSKVRNLEDLERFAEGKYVRLVERDSLADGGGDDDLDGSQGSSSQGRRLVFVGKY